MPAQDDHQERLLLAGWLSLRAWRAGAPIACAGYASTRSTWRGGPDAAVPGGAGTRRLLRLLRRLRLLRLAPAMRRLFSVEGLRYAALLAALTAVAGGAGFATLEGGSTAEGIYWALTTMTTVGYGDLSPDTATGKALAVVVMLVGIGFIAILTA